MSRVPAVFQQHLDNTGDPLIVGKIFTKESGTNIDKVTFKDINETLPHENPIDLTAAGRMPAIFFTGSAKFILTDNDEVQIEVEDPVITSESTSFGEPFNPQTIYLKDEIVSFNGLLYKSLAGGNQNNLPTDTNFWSQIDIWSRFNINENYAIRAPVVALDGRAYTSKIANNLGNDPTTDGGTNWQDVGQPRVWGIAVAYAIDVAVLATDGYIYISQQATTGDDPVSDDGTNWGPRTADLIAGNTTNITKLLNDGTPNNLLLGNFNVNQRAVTGSVVLGAGIYGHDRFRGGSSGCTYTFATSLGVTTVTITAGSLEQVVDGKDIRSGSYILSWTGTAQGQIDGGGFADTGVTATLTGGTNAIIEFDDGTLSLPQLEKGTIVSPFEDRPFNFELDLCQWYFERINSDVTSGRFGVGHIITGTIATAMLHYKEKRIVPSVAASASADFSIISVITTTVLTDLTFNQIQRFSVNAVMTVGAGLTAPDPSYLISSNTNAFIDLSSEF